MNHFHTFGDSHARACSGWSVIPNLKDHSIGPSTAYAFGRDRLSRLNIKNYSVKEGDDVCFCFGEIDCRNHVHKHVIDGACPITIISPIVNLYFRSIKANIEQFDSLRVFVFNVVPPTRYINVDESHPFPYLGTDDDREMYTRLFNTLTKCYCEMYGYIYFDVYNAYARDGFIKSEMSDGCGHINNGCFIKQFYERYSIF